MSARERAKVPTDLVQGAVQLDRWRQTRARGSRIPEPLWQLALELASRHGISRTASALRVGYYELKKRFEHRKTRTSTRSLRPSESPFVELPSISMSIPQECVIEVEKASGAKLRVHFKGPALPDLSALASTFWETC